MTGPILVVGGSGGIGKAIADAFTPNALVWSRRTGVDATDEASVTTAAQRWSKEHAPPFALVHCVGDFEERPLLQTGSDLYHHLLHSNLTSAWLCSRAVVPMMQRGEGGRVLFFAAAGAANHDAKTRAPVYFAIKAALLSLARSLAIEVAANRITVNVLSPGIIRHEHSHQQSQDRMAPRVPLGRAGTLDDIVGAVRFLLSPAGDYITGSELIVDGGLSLLT